VARAKRPTRPEPERLSVLLPSVRDLIQEGRIRIKLSAQGDAQLTYDEVIVAECAADWGLDRAEVERLLAVRLPEMITAILKRTRNYFISFQTEVVPEGEEAPSKQEVEERLRLVEEFLIDDALQRRLAVKRMAKSETFLDASWEVLQKRADDSGPVRGNLLYGTIRVDLDRPGVGETGGVYYYPPWAPRFVPTSMSAFALDLDDVRYLRRLLEQLEGRLSGLLESPSEALP